MKKIIIVLLIALAVVSSWGIGNQAKYEKISGKFRKNSEMKLAGTLPDILGNNSIKLNM